GELALALEQIGCGRQAGSLPAKSYGVCYGPSSSRTVCDLRHARPVQLERRSILVSASDDVLAQGVLAGHPAVRSAERLPGGVHVTLRPDACLAIELVAVDIRRQLVQAGVAVHRLELT